MDALCEMTEETSSKLKSVLEQKGITQAEFARMMGIYPQKVTNWITRGVPNKDAFRVALALEVPIEDVAQEEIAAQATQAKDLMIFGERYQIKRSRHVIAPNDGMVPLIDWSDVAKWRIPFSRQPNAAAALLEPPRPPVENVIDWLPLPLKCEKGRTFATTLQGPGMDDGSPTGYRDGEILFVDTTKTKPEHDADVLIKMRDEDDPVFKRLIKAGSRWYLKSLNPDWPDKICELDSDADTYIIGRVMFSGRAR